MSKYTDQFSNLNLTELGDAYMALRGEYKSKAISQGDWNEAIDAYALRESQLSAHTPGVLVTFLG